MSIPSIIPSQKHRPEKVEKTNAEAPRNPSDHKVEEIGKQLQDQPESIDMDVEFDATLKLEKLPPEILVRIFDKLPKKMHALHRQLPFVSKSINENFQAFVNHQLNQGEIDPTRIGCDTVKKAVQYIINQNLLHAKLVNYLYSDGKDLEQLSTLGSNLITLNLHKGTFTENELVDALKKFSNLQNLTLLAMQFPLSEKFTEVLGTLTHMRSLRLQGDLPFIKTDAFAKALGHLTHLESVRIDNQTVNMDPVNKLINLKDLTLRSCLLKNNIFTENKKVHSVLKNLNLSHCQFSGDQLIALAKAHPKLENLDLFCCSQLPGDDLVKAIKWLPDLKSLNISYCILTNDQLVSIVRECPNLVYLEINFYIVNNYHEGILSKDVLKVLASQFPNVEIKY